MAEDSLLPGAARCVIVGGGVGGTSIAYHLARMGWRDIIVLEQHDLTEGTTWHSAGFVGQLRSTTGQTRMIMYSSELYAELRVQTGRDPGWRGVGSLRLACTPERVQELDRLAGSADGHIERIATACREAFAIRSRSRRCRPGCDRRELRRRDGPDRELAGAPLP